MLFCITAHSQADTTKIEWIDEVTMSATRFAEKNARIAQQIVKFSKEQISTQNKPTTADFLNNSGEVFVQKSQLGGGSPVLRGFEANKILLVVDGIRLNNAIFRGGHLQNVIAIDQNYLSRIEVLFGPASVMYGSDALGGVIHLYTKNPTFAVSGKPQVSGNAFLRVSSAVSEQTAHAEMVLSAKKFASLTSITRSAFGDLRQGADYYSSWPQWGKRSFYVQHVNGIDSMVVSKNPELQKFTGYTQYDILQKVQLKTGKVTHTLNLQLSTTSHIPRYDRLTETNSQNEPKHAEWYYGPQNRLLAAYQLSNLPSTAFFDESQISLAYQKFDESRHNRNYRSPRIFHREEVVDVLSINADFKKNIKHYEIGYGFEAVNNFVASRANFEDINSMATGPADTRYPSAGSKTQGYSIYTSVINKLSKQLTLQMGARSQYSHLYADFEDKTFFPFPFDDISQSSLSLSGGSSLVYARKSNFKLSFAVGVGYRVPNVDDLAKVFESNASALIIPNPSLKPERTLNLEFTVEKKFHKLFHLSLAAWHTRYFNALTLSEASFNNQSHVSYNGNTVQVKMTVNAARAIINGLSLGLKTQFNQVVGFYSTLTVTTGKIKEPAKDYPLDHIPPLYGKTGLSCNLKQLKTDLFVLYNGVKSSRTFNLRGEDNQQYSADPINGFVPAWMTVNASCSWTINKRLRLNVTIENIADRFYRQFASGISAPGRNISISGKVSF